MNSFPAIDSSAYNFPITIDKVQHSAHPFNPWPFMQSPDPGTTIFMLDNIIACKASSAADAFEPDKPYFEESAASGRG